MPGKWSKGGIAVDILSAQGLISSSILISTVAEDLLFDVGDGTLKLLKKRDYRFERLHGIFFTHGHYDHIGGLWGLLGYLRFIRREAQLPIHIPSGSIELKEALSLTDKLYAKNAPFVLITKELKENDSIRIGAIRIRPFLARHSGSISGKKGIIPAFGYTLNLEEVKVVISGDTGPSRQLMEEVKGADYAIIEASFADEEEIPDTHLSVDQAVRIGRLAKEFCLVHLTDSSYSRALKEGLAPED